MHIKLIALDLDGTLLDRHERIHPDTLGAIDEFVSRGGLVAIDTGRPFNAIIRILSENEVLPNAAYPHALIAEEREIYIRKAGAQFEPLTPWNDEIIAAERALITKAREIADSVGEVLAKDEIVSRTPNVALEDERGFIERYYATREEAEKARRITEEHIPDDVPLQVVRNNILVALRHKNIGKGKLLLRLAGLLEIEPHRIFAVGDSHNDLEMLDGKLGFLSGTVANADAHIKEIVRQAGGPVASLPRSQGVGELLRQLLSQ